MPDTPALRTLLYRYFFFAWLFKDAACRNLFERSAALRHNREAARWLPTYMRRWAVVGGLAWMMGGATERLFDAPMVSLLFFLPCAMSVPVGVVIVVAWVGLRLQ